MKPNTFTKLYIHIVFAPRGRRALPDDSLIVKLHKYIYGIIKEKQCFPMIVNGMNDHVHILLSLRPDLSISDLVRDIKRSSSLFLNQDHKADVKFSWQEGYGAFSVSYSDLDRVFHYIENQQEHHKNRKFREEYISILANEKIEFKTEYLFEFYD